ncbi:hypothetical protein [Amycolatopsis sp. NPDC052450]|uniref:hypothetical protein n=1 Tax=Amycolatopsis sp. NPDC052450 TaxID=3363937 RepID=UPI0037C9BC14
MVDAVITWIGQKFAEKALDRAVASGGRKRQRHDLSVQGAEATSDLDITVKYTLPYCRGAKAPVVLTLRRVDRFTESLRLDMVLGETARVRLKRGRYEITAKIHELSPRLGPEPILHAVGSQLLWLGGNGTAKACIRPAPVLIRAPKESAPKQTGFWLKACPMCGGPGAGYALCPAHSLHVSRYIVEVLVPRMRAS